MFLETAALTTSGRPMLQQGEIERYLLDKVDLEFGSGPGGIPGQLADAYKDGYVILTSLRLIWLERVSSNKRSCALPIQCIQSYQRKTQLAFKPKVRLHLDVCCNTEGKPLADGGCVEVRRISLRCRGEGPDQLMVRLEEALQTRVQAAPAATAANASSKAVDSLPPALPPPLPAARLPDNMLLAQVMNMGFPRNQAARALVATNNEGVQQAIDYLLAFGDQPGMDEPLEIDFKMQSSSPGIYPSVMSEATSWPLPLGAASAQHTTFGNLMASAADSMQPCPGPAAQQPPRLAAQDDIAAAWASRFSPGASSYSGPSAVAASSFGGWSVTEPSAASSSGFSMNPSYSGTSVAGGFAAPSSGSSSGYGAPGSAAMPSGLPAGSSMIGVAGIVRRVNEKTAETGRSLDLAFQDLTALMAMAADMVKLAEKFRGVLVQVDDSSSEDMMDRETQLELISMGIASPVTKESAGARYHIELSCQLADFLDEPLNKSGGMMTLSDVYCLFNRARGTELVSPDDLLQAVKMFPQVGLPLKLRTLPSGLVVVQNAQSTDEQVCARVASLVATSETGSSEQPPLGPAITASEVAKALAVTVTIAKEYLLTAELQGVLCRDEGPDGLRFYRNFFPQIPAAAVA